MTAVTAEKAAENVAEDVATPDEALSPEGPEKPAEAPAEGTEDEGKTFDAAYVQKLRNEAAQHRTRAKDRDALAERLHTMIVANTGRLADPTDLPFSEEYLTNDAALSAAIDSLLARKPHLASRRVVGDIGLGMTSDPAPVNLANLLRRNA